MLSQSHEMQLPMFGPVAVPWEHVLVVAHHPQLPVGAVVQSEHEVHMEQPLPDGAAVGVEGHSLPYQSQLTVGQKPTVGPDAVPCSHLLFERHQPQLALSAVTQR